MTRLLPIVSSKPVYKYVPLPLFERYQTSMLRSLFSDVRALLGHRVIAVIVFALSIFNNAYALDCGDGNRACTVKEIASFLERIKETFGTNDYVYDQIYAEGDFTLVFHQRILKPMDRMQREYVKQHGANKESNLPTLCANERLRFILNQGVVLRYQIKELDRNLINTFEIRSEDCVQ